METLPKDIVEKMTNELSPTDLITFCSIKATSSKTTKNIQTMCNDNSFWNRRFQKDFNFLQVYFSSGLRTNAKQIYLDVFSRISKQVEKMLQNVMNLYGDFSKYLSVEYKKDVYKHLYEATLDELKNYLDDYSLDDVDTDDIEISYDTRKFVKFLPDFLTSEFEILDYLESSRFFEAITVPLFQFTVDMVKYIKGI